MHLSTEALLICLESLTVRGAWATAAAKIGCAESTLFLWLTRSKRAAETRDIASPFYFEWRDRAAFFHEHAKRARAENIMSLEALVRDEARNGQTEYVRDPSTGRKIPQLDPEFLGVSDQEMSDNFLDPVRDRWLWLYNDAGERVEPLWEVKTVPQPASLRATVLRGLLPQTFGERADVNVTHRGAVVHVVEPAKYIPRAEREQIVDAQFSEVTPRLSAPELRPDIEMLRAEAARLMREGPRNPTPQGVVKDADGLPVGRTKPVNDPADDVRIVKPSIPLGDHPRAYLQPKPEPRPRPSYARQPLPGKDRCMKIA